MKKLMMATLFISAVAATSTTMLAETRIRVEGSWGNGSSYGYGAYYPEPVYAPPPPPPPQYGYYGYRPSYVVVRPVAPAPDYVWIDGCHEYDRFHRSYYWRAGYWARRPYRDAEWIGPRYHEGRYHHGHWRR